MGYGYLGAYLAFGQGLDEKTSEGILQTLNEEHEILASLYHDEEFPHVFVKRYGTDEYCNAFVCWGPVYKGGEFWASDTCGVPGPSSPEKLLPMPSAKEFLSHEQTFDPQEWDRFCIKYNLTSELPQWQTLICFGQGIY